MHAGRLLRHCQLIKPPLGALPFLNGLVATIKDRNETKLKLEGIAFDECTVKHLDGMHKSDLPRDCRRCPIDPHESNLPRSTPFIAIPNYVAPSHPPSPLR